MYVTKLCNYATTLAQWHYINAPNPESAQQALGALERAQTYMVYTLASYEKYSHALARARQLFDTSIKAHGSASTQVLAVRPLIMSLYALKLHRVTEAMQPQLGSPTLSRRTATLAPDLQIFTAAIYARLSHHIRCSAVGICSQIGRAHV